MQRFGGGSQISWPAQHFLHLGAAFGSCLKGLDVVERERSTLEMARKIRGLRSISCIWVYVCVAWAAFGSCLQGMDVVERTAGGFVLRDRRSTRDGLQISWPAQHFLHLGVPLRGMGSIPGGVFDHILGGHTTPDLEKNVSLTLPVFTAKWLQRCVFTFFMFFHGHLAFLHGFFTLFHGHVALVGFSRPNRFSRPNACSAFDHCHLNAITRTSRFGGCLNGLDVGRCRARG